MLKFKAKPLLEMLMATKEEQVILVGDMGVYFMPRTKGAPPPETVIYAEGCNSKKDKDWYLIKEDECGGDDFFQPFSAKELRKIVVGCPNYLIIHMTETHLRFASE